MLFSHRNHTLRDGRYSEENRVYLVTNCCHERQPFFLHPASAQLVIHEMMRSDKTGRTRTLAYVAMPDHVHWLFQLRANDALDKVIQRMKGRSARRINLLLNRNGPLWQAGFHDRALRSDECLVTAADYVVHNPVRAGISSHPDDYPFSGIVGSNRNVWAAVDDPISDRG